MMEPRRIWWARPRKLCALERPGGGGRSHRPERRAEEIAYLKDAGVHTVISVMRTRHNLAEYEATGLNALHVPVAEDADGLLQAAAAVRRATRRAGAVAIHGNRHTDFVAAVCACHVAELGRASVTDALQAACEAGLAVTPEAAALAEADPDWIEGLLAAA